MAQSDEAIFGLWKVAQVSSSSHIYILKHLFNVNNKNRLDSIQLIEWTSSVSISAPFNQLM